MITRRRFIAQSALVAPALLLHGGNLPGRESVSAADPLQERLALDVHRPQYHFLPKANWVNDPNGPIFWKGYCHLFYQYSSTIFPQGPKYWGHARSKDMVHWEHLPMALAPTPGGPDKDGCWSGSAFINEGVPTLIYTGVLPQVQCLATSDDDMTTWKKFSGNPVVGSPPDEPAVTGFRDPSIWREGDSWLMTVGAGFQGKGGAVFLYSSRNLAHWDYLGPLFTAPPFERRDSARSGKYEPIGSGDMWECPDFFPLGQKHVLLVSSQGRVHYFVGTYSHRKFLPETQGLIDGCGLHYASKTFADGRGRRILWGWIREGRSKAAQNSAGWSGAISLPRVLSIAADGTLRMEPLAELAQLRGRRHRIMNSEVTGLLPVSGACGSSLEIQLTMDPGEAKECGLTVRRSPDAAEEVVISYNAATQNVVLSGAHSSLSPEAIGGTYQCQLKLEPSELLRLTIFLDASVVEVFANGRACLTGRTYPTRSDSLGAGIFAHEGRARVKSLDAYEMKAISRDRMTT
jgi:beta-fructofuranosidase